MNETQQTEVNVDGALSRFFRSAMPDPWPECQALSQPERPVSRLGFRSLGRLALAASILLFFLSYLFLSGLFPTPGGGNVDHRGDVASKPGHGPKVHLQHPAAAPSRK